MNLLYRDQPVGLPGGKIGILTRPAVEPTSPRPVVVALNTGVIHRVGHARMYVALARRLAARGHTVLRFDLSGIGDSEKRHDALPTEDAALADIREVMDWLEGTAPPAPVALIGLCTGAHLAVLHGGMDSRVGGVIILDPFIPRTLRFYFTYFSKKAVRILRDPPSWSGMKEAFGSAFKRTRRGPLGGTSEASFLVRVEDPVVRAKIEQSFKTAILRRLKMLMVLTGGLPRQHNYGRQHLDAFPHLRFANLLSAEYWGDTDHVFSHPVDRERLFREVESWLDELTLASTQPEERICSMSA